MGDNYIPIDTSKVHIAQLKKYEININNIPVLQYQAKFDTRSTRVLGSKNQPEGLASQVQAHKSALQSQGTYPAAWFHWFPAFQQNRPDYRGTCWGPWGHDFSVHAEYPLSVRRERESDKGLHQKSG